MEDVLENSEKRIVIKFHYPDGNHILFLKLFHIQEWIDIPQGVSFACSNRNIRTNGAGIKEITLMRDGMHIVVYTDEVISYYFQSDFTQYDELIEAFKRMFEAQPEVLSIID
ncbi:MAG: hypothetical protein AAF902_16400 [Chloroflexota bacterium]